MQDNKTAPAIDANEIEVVDAIVVGQHCVPGEVCQAKEYFEMITECVVCGSVC